MSKWTIAVSSLFLAQTVLAANAAPKYLWSESQGLVAASSCEAATASDIDLRVDESPANDRVLRLANELEKKMPLMKDAADYVIELRGSPLTKTIGDSANRIAGSFWQIRMDGERYAVALCGPAKSAYVLFNVFVQSSSLPVAEIGVNPASLALFRGARIHSPEEAEKAIDAPSASSPSSALPALGKESASALSLSEAISRRLPPAAVKPQLRAQAPSSPLQARGTVAAPSAAAAPGARATAVTTAGAKSPAVSRDGSREISRGASARPAAPAPVVAGTRTHVASGTLEYVLCVADGSVQVRGQKLDDVLFKARKLERVTPIQAFGAETREKIINAKRQKFSKVQFPERKGLESTGWVPESLVQLQADCEYTAKKNAARASDDSSTDNTTDNSQSSSLISSLNDADCCNFPMKGRPERSYLEGMRRFRASRSHGRRLHAACDLYRPNGEAVSAVAPGKIVRGKYFFYQGVFAVEARHPGGFIARYGEILGRSAPNASEGSSLKAGQTIGYVGTVNSGCCEPMLHFELYSGKSTGSLSQRWRRGFERRDDLLDPTPYLQKWERKKFGENY